MLKENETVEIPLGQLAKLQFEFFPAFASYLLETKMMEFAAERWRCTLSVNFPGLNYYDFNSYTEKEMIDRSIETNRKFLVRVSDNELADDVFEPMKMQKAEKSFVPLTERTEVDRITFAGSILKKTLMKFIPEYCSGISEAVELSNEINEYVTEAVYVSFRSSMYAQQKKITQLNKSLEQKNKALERSNKEVASFSYIASHDLQEPLRKIKSFSNLIKENDLDELSEDGKEYFERIVSSAISMQKLVDDLLSFSRTQTNISPAGPTDVNLILDEIKKSHTDSIRKGHLIIKSGNLPVINAVPLQLHQLFENVIGNSVKYKKENLLEINITSEVVNGRQLSFEDADRDKTYYRISVADNGIGFDQKHAEKIFEIFQRLHGANEYSGTGIGLAICKKIAENHSGFIKANGRLNDGAVFDIYLPA